MIFFLINVILNYLIDFELIFIIYFDLLFTRLTQSQTNVLLFGRYLILRAFIFTIISLNKK